MRRDLEVGALVVVTTPYGPAALSPEVLSEALERGRALVPVADAPRGAMAAPERLLSAGELEQVTSVPASWFEECARQGRLPHYAIGRYRRFKLSEVAAATAFPERSP